MVLTCSEGCADPHPKVTIACWFAPLRYKHRFPALLHLRATLPHRSSLLSLSRPAASVLMASTRYRSTSQTTLPVATLLTFAAAKLCRNFALGHCPQGENCKYIHSMNIPTAPTLSQLSSMYTPMVSEDPAIRTYVDSQHVWYTAGRTPCRTTLRLHVPKSTKFDVDRFAAELSWGTSRRRIRLERTDISVRVHFFSNRSPTSTIQAVVMADHSLSTLRQESRLVPSW